MREILFRGKRKDNGEWIEGYYCNCVKAVGMETIPSIQQTNDNSLYFREVIPETIGQFTGLTDKNGKKIFEGDIIGYEWHSDIRDDYYKYYGKYRVEGIVRYGNFNCSCCDGVFGWYIEDGDIRGFEGHTDLEVIGNKWENPELLGE